MPPAITPIPPVVFKELLEKDGFSVEMETENNWTLFKETSPGIVITLPRKGKLLSVTVMMGIVDKIRMTNKAYFDLLRKVKN